MIKPGSTARCNYGGTHARLSAPPSFMVCLWLSSRRSPCTDLSQTTLQQPWRSSQCRSYFLWHFQPSHLSSLSLGIVGNSPTPTYASKVRNRLTSPGANSHAGLWTPAPTIQVIIDYELPAAAVSQLKSCFPSRLTLNKQWRKPFVRGHKKNPQAQAIAVREWISAWDAGPATNSPQHPTHIIHNSTGQSPLSFVTVNIRVLAALFVPSHPRKNNRG